MAIRRLNASGNILLLICVMYFITYMDRVNVSTAAAAFKSELGLSNTQLGLAFSAFAYPYLACQVIGGWFGDRFGARRTLTVCGLIWVAVWAWYYRDDPRTHPGMRPADLAALPPPRATAAVRGPTPWGPLVRRMGPVTFVYFCYGWTLWTFLTWVPQFMLHAYKLNLGNSALFASLVFAGGVVGDALGGWVSDALYRRTGSLIRARRDLVILGMVGSFVCSAPVLFVTSPALAALSLGSAFFFAELTIGPMWAIPMDIAPAYSGTASGLMNSGSALAAILSPLVFGVIIDATGDWSLPFYGTMALLAAGTVAAFWMRPDHGFNNDATAGMRQEAPKLA